MKGSLGGIVRLFDTFGLYSWGQKAGTMCGVLGNDIVIQGASLENITRDIAQNGALLRKCSTQACTIGRTLPV